MDHDAKLFFPDRDILVVQISTVDVAFAKGKTLILDEADDMIDNFKLVLNS